MTKEIIDLKLKIIANLIHLEQDLGVVEREMTEATIKNLEEQLKLKEVFA